MRPHAAGFVLRDLKPTNIVMRLADSACYGFAHGVAGLVVFPRGRHRPDRGRPRGAYALEPPI